MCEKVRVPRMVGRRFWIMAVAVTFVVAALSTSETSLAATRVMPLGDSITEAATGHASYRYWLWHELLERNDEVDFVGSRFGVLGGPPLYEDFDQDHEGHWGWRADEILVEIAGWAAAEQPDVVLIHLGHNDLWQGQTVDSTIDDLAEIVGELRSVLPTITILLAQVIPSEAPGLSDIPILNAAIVQLSSQLDTPTSRLIAVDQWTGFDAAADTYDGTHPNENGERKISLRWNAALREVLDPAGLVFQDGFESGSTRRMERTVATAGIPDLAAVSEDYGRLSRHGRRNPSPWPCR